MARRACDALSASAASGGRVLDSRSVDRTDVRLRTTAFDSGMRCPHGVTQLLPGKIMLRFSGAEGGLGYRLDQWIVPPIRLAAALDRLPADDLFVQQLAVAKFTAFQPQNLGRGLAGPRRRADR